jgi:putative transposase
MINKEHHLPIGRQARLLSLSRSSVYYKPRPVSEADLKLMHRIDKLHMEFPFAGSRMLQGLLVQDGVQGRAAACCHADEAHGHRGALSRPNTSKPAPGHKIYPYLLRKLPITRPNQVWAMDITYIPMARGFVYLAAVLDWFTRRVLAWRVSITLEAEFCMEAVEEAWRNGKPEIFNSDQGGQFTSIDFIKVLPPARSRSAWMARGPGATTSSSSACGGPSNTRRSTCGPMPASPRRAPLL